jgi:exodeoxyribonuclease VII small subunit
MAKPKPIEKLTFEEAYKELEELVRKLETGDQPLEESLVLFERGQALSAHCNRLLEEAELKLTQLAPDMESLQDEFEFDLDQ